MTDDIFGAPAAAEGIKWADLKGQLVLVKPHSTEKVMTAFGESDCVRADVTILDGQEAGDTHTDVLIFPKVLQSQLRPSVATGKFVLGRVGQGVAKPGQSAPWRLEDPTDADKTLARDHISKAAPIPF